MAGQRLRALEMVPSLIRGLASESVFDIALLADSGHLPAHWQTSVVGDIRCGLFGRPALAEKLGPQPLSEEQLAGVPFVMPVFSHEGRFLPVVDHCPLSASLRRAGDEAQSLAIGLNLAAASNQVVFGPVVAAAPLVRSGSLVELCVRGWDVRYSLLLAANADRVAARVHRQILEGLQQALVALDANVEDTLSARSTAFVVCAAVAGPCRTLPHACWGTVQARRIGGSEDVG